MLSLAFAAAAQAAPAATPPAPPPPSVSMDVARARVEKVKTLFAVAASGDAAALAKIAAAGATTDINGAMGLLSTATITGLKGCTRVKPYEVNETDVVLTLKCTGGLPTDTTAVVTFSADGQIEKVGANQSVYVPPAPAESR
ncbi:hypothetical protein [Sphingomonas sp.]|uniref:hypothetical protein n=1 Tax=Sphingomonas sp. TaxID=28214 RepID=UPI002C9E2B1D|nr:hypothetical protein [Sphingomonas sp.]HWK37029.1 hypothetical protein [Sphingomonas sp.]